VDENFARAAFSTPVNGISDVVQTGFGLHLIKVTERKPGEPSDFSKIKEDVRFFCVDEMRMSLLNDLRKSGQIEVTLP
jgi:peptidyl-prolyl cis-trans isomerase C